MSPKLDDRLKNWLLFLLNPCILSLLCLKQHGWAYFFFSKISCDAPTWGAWIKDALLIGWRREEKSPPPGGIWIHDLSFAPQVCSLPLCYNHCPRRVYDVFYVQLGNKLRPNKMSFGPRFLIDSPSTRNTNLRLMVFCWWIVFGINSKWFFRLN